MNENNNVKIKRDETNTKSSGIVSFLQSKIDISLIIVTILLLLIGLITLLSASSSIGLSDTGDAYYYAKKQVFAIGIGLIAALIFTIIDYRIFAKKIVLGLIMFSILSLIALVKILGIDEGGAQRWIIIGGFNFQPSEFIKLGMIIFMSGILTKIIKQGKIKSLSKGFLLPLGIIVFIAGLIFFLQNHLSAALVIGVVSVIQMFVAGTNLVYLLTTGGIGLTGIIIFLLNISADTTNFRAERILAWLDPEKYIQGKGWQIMQSLYAIGLRRVNWCRYRTK